MLACDGIWDVLSNQVNKTREVCRPYASTFSNARLCFQEVVDFVTRRIASGLEPEDVCEELMTRCLATDWEAIQ